VALLVQGITNSGLQSAIIQHEHLDDVQASALFWASLRWNALLCLGMAASGLVLMPLYQEPRVLPVTIAWAVITFGATLSAIHEALLKRQFRFGVVLVAHLTGLVLSLVVAIVAAQRGAQYWAIILQMAVVEFVRVGIIWIVLPWRPLPWRTLGAERHTAVAELRAYWRGFAGSRLLGWTGEQADRFAVGITGGTAMLGLYDVAKRWGTFAFLELYTPLSEVAIASLSAVRRDPGEYALRARNAFLPVLAVSLPIVGFLFAEPRGVLRFLFGEQWLPAAPILRWLAVATAALTIGRLAYWVSLSSGQAGRTFQWTLRATPVFLVCVLVGVQWGAEGTSIGVAVANIATGVPCLFFLLATTTLRAGPILRTWAVPLLASAGGVTLLLALDDKLPSADSFGGLMVRGAIHVAAYLLLWMVIPGGRTLIRDLRQGASATPVVETRG
jgi:PST family polysaccharide transporter